MTDTTSDQHRRTMIALMRLTQAADVLLTRTADADDATRSQYRRDLVDAVDQAWDALRPGVPDGRPDHVDPAPAGWVPPAATRIPPNVFAAAVEGAASLDSYAHTPYGLNLIAHAVAAITPTPAPPDAPGDTEPSDTVTRRMHEIAEQHGAVEYDQFERPDEVAAILTAARRADLIAIPTDQVPPRTFRGADLPTLHPTDTTTGHIIDGRGHRIPVDVRAWYRAARRVGHPTPTTRPAAAGVGVQHQVDLVLDEIRPILTATLTEATQCGNHATETPAAAWSRGYDAGAAAPRYEIPPAGTGG